MQSVDRPAQATTGSRGVGMTLWLESRMLVVMLCGPRFDCLLYSVLLCCCCCCVSSRLPFMSSSLSWGMWGTPPGSIPPPLQHHKNSRPRNVKCRQDLTDFLFLFNFCFLFLQRIPRRPIQFHPIMHHITQPPPTEPPHTPTPTPTPPPTPQLLPRLGPASPESPATS